MLQNRKLLIITVICLTVILIQAGRCAAAVDVAAPALPEVRLLSSTEVLVKFAVVMCGVILSLLVIWFGLSLYKKCTAKTFKIGKNLYNDGLSSPKTIDEALVFFINKNRLK